MAAFLERLPQDVALRLAVPIKPGGPEIVLSDVGGAERTDPGMIPFVLASAIMVPLFTAGGLLLRGLTQEKESRIMEVLLVSLRPGQLLAGKLLGMGALIAVQYLGWLLVLQVVQLVTGRQSVGPAAGAASRHPTAHYRQPVRSGRLCALCGDHGRARRHHAGHAQQPELGFYRHTAHDGALLPLDGAGGSAAGRAGRWPQPLSLLGAPGDDHARVGCTGAGVATGGEPWR